MFIRTSSGLRNTALFYGVAYTVYTEGKKNLSVSEILAGAGRTDGPDVRFWSVLFTRFAPNLRCHFRAIGGKMVVLEMARQIARGNIHNVITCVDADHEHRKGYEVTAPYLLRTYGYSWENDVVSRPILNELHDILCLAPMHSRRHHLAIGRGWRLFVRSARRMVQLDVLYRLKYGDLPLATTRGEALQSGTEKVPLALAPFAAHVKKLRKDRPRPALPVPQLRVDVERECNGHLVLDFAYKACRALFERSCGQVTVSKQVFASMLLSVFQMRLNNRTPIVAHHRKQFSGLLSYIVQPLVENQ